MYRNAFDSLIERYQSLVKDYCKYVPSGRIDFQDCPLSLMAHPTDWDASRMYHSITLTPDKTTFIGETIFGTIEKTDLRYESIHNVEGVIEVIEKRVSSYHLYNEYVNMFYRRFPSGKIYYSDGYLGDCEELWDSICIDLNHGGNLIIKKIFEENEQEINLTKEILSGIEKEIESKLEKYGKVPPQKEGK